MASLTTIDIREEDDLMRLNQPAFHPVFAMQFAAAAQRKYESRYDSR